MRTGPNAGVYTIDPDGRNERLVRSAGEVPRWSPDGTLLTLVEDHPDGPVLVVIKPDGSGRRVIHPDPTLNLGVAVWSPDGTWLAVEGWDDKKPSRNGVWLMRAKDGSGLRQLTTGHAVPGGFSPDGREVSYVRLSEDEAGSLGVVDVDTGKSRAVGDLTVGLYSGFMPDGQSLFATSEGRIVILDRSGHQIGKVEVAEPHMIEAGLSRDGQHFVFGYDPEAAAAPGIYRTDLHGGDFAKVVHTDIGGIEEVAPDWGP